MKKYGLDRPVAGDPVHIQLAKTGQPDISGPNSRYKSDLAGVKPTRPDEQKQSSVGPTNPNFVDNKQAIDLLASMNAKLDILNQSSRKTADAAHKTAKNTS